MDKDSRNRPAESLGVFDETWFDPIEIGVRDRIRGFIEALVEAELNEGHCHGNWVWHPGRRRTRLAP
jgi:hypothetical protein